MSSDSRPRSQNKHPAHLRLSIRLGALGLAVLIACIGPHVWVECGRLVPGLSPYLLVCSAIARRGMDLGFLLALPLLIVAFLRGRWFCLWLCPTGTLAWLAGRVFPRRKTPALPRLHLGRWLAALTLGGAVAGYSWFLWLDPLAIWNGFFSACWPGRISGPEMWLGLGLVLVVLSGFLVPHLWCERLCPLGACQHELGSFGAWIRQRVRERLRKKSHESGSPDNTLAGCSVPAVGAGRPSASMNIMPGERAEECSAGRGLHRRGFLAIGAGLGALFALGRVMRSSVAGDSVRPPGATPGDRFSGLCARCGACFRACPHEIIAPDLGEGGFAALLTPRLSFEERYCSEWCRECTRVCPTGAIRELSLEAKRRTALGLAVVNRNTCLAWSQNQSCMICDEYCPYDAIEGTQVNGQNCPVVDERICAGCGACESQCPVRPEKAIRVRGHAVQRDSAEKPSGRIAPS